MTGPAAQLLDDGRRLHLAHGPIDLIIEAFGSPQRVARAYELATSRFATVLDELVSELPLLRARCPAGGTVAGSGLRGVVARSMHDAVLPHAAAFITPMAAVAGAVADEILSALCAAGGLERAYVNNGGDIAFYLAPGRTITAGLVAGDGAPHISGTVTIAASDLVRGMATSGYGGRSLSRGIADAVTCWPAPRPWPMPPPP